MSTGLIYLPGTFATTDEIIALAKVVSTNGGIYTSHMRSEGDEIFEALEELFSIARAAHIPAHVSHIKLGGQRNWHQTDRVLDMITAAREEGLDITQDQYVYTASSTSIGSLIPEAARAGGGFAARMEDIAFEDGIIAEMTEEAEERGTDFSYAVIAAYEADPSLNGLNIAEAAQVTRNDDSLQSQIRTILEIELRGGASGVFHSINEEDLVEFLRHPNTMIAADSSVRTWQYGVPHPRGYGNNARVLARYVREQKVLRLEDAVRRMTSLPATTFGIKDRGTLREGAWADLVIFDPGKVNDLATFEQPHQYATGFDLVMVNGQAITIADGPTDKKPGHIVRRGK